LPGPLIARDARFPSDPFHPLNHGGTVITSRSKMQHKTCIQKLQAVRHRTILRNERLVSERIALENRPKIADFSEKD